MQAQEHKADHQREPRDHCCYVRGHRLIFPATCAPVSISISSPSVGGPYSWLTALTSFMSSDDACSASTAASTAKTLQPRSQSDCGSHSGVLRGVIEVAPSVTDCQTTSSPRHATNSAMAARLSIATQLSTARTIAGSREIR